MVSRQLIDSAISYTMKSLFLPVGVPGHPFPGNLSGRRKCVIKLYDRVRWKKCSGPAEFGGNSGFVPGALEKSNIKELVSLR